MNSPFQFSTPPSPANAPKRAAPIVAAAPPRAPRMPSFVSAAMLGAARTFAEEWFRTATREDLERMAREIAAVDREKTLLAAAVLVFAAGRDAPHVPSPNKDVLVWLYKAGDADMRALAERLVEGMQPQASALAHELDRALNARFDRKGTPRAV